MSVEERPGPEIVREAEDEGAAEAEGWGEDLDLAELRVALDDLRAQIQSRLAQRGPAAPGARDWIALFEELRRRAGAFGMVERSGEVDEFGMDDVVLQRSRPLLDFLADQYWRADCVGLEHVPAKGPLLFVANRSGVLPYDGIMLSHLVQRHRPHEPRPRFLVADWLITLPFAQPTLARIGGVRACRENADRLLRSGISVVAFPEGGKGATKVFRERYQLKRFGRGGVVRTALENGVPLVPVAVVGAEEAHPVLFKWTTPARMVGLPFLPVTPTFPWLGPAGALPLPSHWILHFGEPLDLEELTSGPRAWSDDPLLLSRLTEELRLRIDELLRVALARRGSIWK